VVERSLKNVKLEKMQKRVLSSHLAMHLYM
jgi:hypothetical protein